MTEREEQEKKIRSRIVFSYFFNKKEIKRMRERESGENNKQQKKKSKVYM